MENTKGVLMDIEIWPGDIFSVPNHNISGWVNKHLTKTPAGKHTDRFHFGVVGDPIYRNSRFIDYETRESINKGPASLRFFAQYEGKDVTLYRLPGITTEQGLELVRSISTIGDKPYGYIDFVQALLDVAWLVARGKFPPYTAQQFQFSRNDKYICTELAAYGCNYIGKPIEPPDALDVWVIPTVYLQAVDEGRLDIYYQGNLRDLHKLMKEQHAGMVTPLG
jgi:hypothetical protein